MYLTILSDFSCSAPAKSPFPFYLVSYLYITFIQVLLTQTWSQSSLHTSVKVISIPGMHNVLHIGTIKMKRPSMRLAQTARAFLNILPRTWTLLYTSSRITDLDAFGNCVFYTEGLPAGFSSLCIIIFSCSSALRRPLFPILFSTSLMPLVSHRERHHRHIPALPSFIWRDDDGQSKRKDTLVLEVIQCQTLC